MSETGLYTYDEKIKPIKRIDFGILPMKTIKDMSALNTGIETADLYENTEEKKGGLNDRRLGSNSFDKDCATCSLSSNYCNGHFAYIDLAEPVFQIIFLQYVRKILSCVC